MKQFVVLIPAFKPDKKLLSLVDELIARSLKVHIVDDGSGDFFTPIFEAAARRGATVRRYPDNRGKGGAIKVGIADLMEMDGLMGVVTADADGQHKTQDIIRVMDEMERSPNALVLGVRHFTGKVPLRSRMGNGITRAVFYLATGHKVTDTQTGLRGLPACLFKQLLKLEGERYEYEMNMLLKIDEWGIRVSEVSIETIYIDENASSHFDTVRDSFRIYKQIAAFMASSIICFFIDYGLFILTAIIGVPSVYVRYLLARVISSCVNYSLNRHMVFKSGTRNSAIKYFILVLFVAGTGALGSHLLATVFTSSVVAKILVDLPLFFLNYFIQKRIVFKKKEAVSQV